MNVDPGSPWYIDDTYVLLRLLLAILLGGLIGFEREASNHSAGLRTNILVCLGSCLLMLLSIYGFSDFIEEENVRVDPARLAAAVITGIGFLGAGTIAFTGKAITGLTSAASIWVVTGIGLAVGAGFYFAAVTATILVVLTLWALSKIEKRYINGKKQQVYRIHAAYEAGMLGVLERMVRERNVVIRKISVHDEFEEGRAEAQQIIQVMVTLPKTESPIGVFEELRRVQGVHAVSME